MASLSASEIDPLSEPAETLKLRRMVDWIWHIRGEVPLPAGQSADEAFARLEPLLTHPGTTHARMENRVQVAKKDPLAQDPLSVIDSGTLHIGLHGKGLILRYHLISRALLYCFLAPLFFLSVAQLTVALGSLEKPTAEEKAKAEEKEKKDKKAEIKLNPVDTFLGAPAPEKPEDEKSKSKNNKKEPEEPKGFSPTPAYVFAGIFAALYVLGRLLEPWLIKRLLRRQLAD